MILLLAAALVVLSIGVLLYPFLRDRFQPEANESQQSPVPVIDEVEDVLDAIRTLQLEFQLGNVPEKQYREELQAYRVQAAAKLRDQMESQTQDANLELEQEVLMARLGVRGDGAGRMCPACVERLFKARPEHAPAAGPDRPPRRRIRQSAAIGDGLEALDNHGCRCAFGKRSCCRTVCSLCSIAGERCNGHWAASQWHPWSACSSRSAGSGAGYGTAKAG